MSGFRKWCLYVLTVGLVYLPLLGCGGGGNLNPVTGKVTYQDGKPIAKGSIAFHPDDKKGNNEKKVPSGEIDNGAYTLYTDGKPGAPAGWYKVTIAAMTEVDSSKPEQAKSLVAEKFTLPQQTPLSVQIPGGAYDLKVSAK